MPGRKLSSVEIDLAKFWDDPPADFPKPLLRQIKLDGGPGLRGVRSIVLPIPYPVTAICGRNGVGKTSLLSLAALSATPPDDWRVFWGNTRPRIAPNRRVRYAFSDFFPRTRGQPSRDGLRITWLSMDSGSEVELTKEFRGGQWTLRKSAGRVGAAPSFPKREIDFIPMSRVLSGGEVGAVRTAFPSRGAKADLALTAESLQQLSYVMGKPYQSVETHMRRGLSMHYVASGSPYSGFDMGGGEASVIAILSRLQSMPLGGLVLVEELEVGLHAEAQARLVEVLVAHSQRRRVQILLTTHSEVVLDRLPRRARVLIRAPGGEHEALLNVSTRFAVHDMVGEVQPELIVYTEDGLSACIAEEAISSSVRQRCVAIDVGSNVTLARQAVSHLRSGSPAGAVSVFDGDCKVAEVENWIIRERGGRTDLSPDFHVLPGGAPPERWLIQELQSEDYVKLLAAELRCDDATARGHVTAMQVDLDHHAIAHTLAQRTGLDQQEAQRALVRSVAATHPALQGLRDKINQMLGDA